MDQVDRKKKAQQNIRDQYALSAKADKKGLTGTAKRHQEQADKLVAGVIRGNFG